jgi:hypothetical protein
MLKHEWQLRGAIRSPSINIGIIATLIKPKSMQKKRFFLQFDLNGCLLYVF